MDFDKLNDLKGFMPQHEGKALGKMGGTIFNHGSCP